MESNQINYNTALEHYQKALAVAIELHREKSAQVADIYKDMAMACTQNGNYDVALEYYLKVLAICLELWGKKVSKQCYCICMWQLCILSTVSMRRL
ncbi:MAG: tetratricopeptide repeat protein [Bacteroidia bacterium]|nr:tetratricopeptide repeat protein [Bacteroidia bacterium]MDW8159665.1 tetratricopeptide repeat protein [Bacteroidia bacterium]